MNVKTQLNQSIWSIPMPDRIKRLPISRNGFPVPWFVAWIDAAPDFRVANQEKLVMAVKRNLCWICGQSLGVHKVFPIGPMCAINRTIAEPPSHFECADYSARACPFLTQPRMRRNEKDMPDNKIDPAGIAIMRNPGAICLWVTKSYKPFRVGNGVLFELGEPERVVWYCEGRTATRAEVQHSIDTGLPTLMAKAEQEGQDAVDELNKCIARAQLLLPEK